MVVNLVDAIHTIENQPAVAAHKTSAPTSAGQGGQGGHVMGLGKGATHPQQQKPGVFFINAQYMMQDVRAVGKGRQAAVTLPVAAGPDTRLVEMGPHDRTTGGRCGACAAMGW